MEYMKVSIVMPVYNGAKYIEKSIESVLAQRYSNWELICVDDTSSDNSFELLQKYASYDRRIKVYRKVNERFGNRATKYGLQYCQGEYFIYMSQDDMLSDDLLESNFSALIESGLDVVVPKMKYYDISTGTVSDFKICCTQNVIDGCSAFILSLDWRIHGFAMWPMSLVNSVGWTTEYLNDDEYTARMLFFNSKKVGFSQGVFYYHNCNPDAITVKWSVWQLDFVATDAKLYDFVVKNDFDISVVQTVCDRTKNDFLRAVIILSDSYANLSTDSRKEALSALVATYKKYRLIINKSTMSLKERFVLHNSLLLRLLCIVKF